MRFKRLLLVGLLVLLTSLLKAEERTYDVVVVGAGTGGFGAALQASRLGARVALVEETDWIGGQMSAAAVSTMDEGGKITLNSGIYGEFLRATTAEYAKKGKSVGTCYNSTTHHCFEPSMIQKVLYAMIEQSRAQGHVLDLLLGNRVVQALHNGNTVTGVVTDTGLTLHAAVVIDATEYGDVLPMTPAAYRLGNATSDDLKLDVCLQKITYVAVIKKYPKGVPDELVMRQQPPGYTAEMRDKLELSLSNSGNAYGKVPPVNLAMHNVYRGLPDSSNPGNYDGGQPWLITKSELNWFNDWPMEAKDVSGTARVDENCAAKLNTIQQLYYIQHDMGQSMWAVANDEGFDTPYNRAHACANIPNAFRTIERNLPVIPYVRESRRIVGMYTLTAEDIRREGTPAKAVTMFPTSIAVGDYADDLHGCGGEETLEHDLEHRGDLPPEWRVGPFQVPIESLIPEKVDGLLAAEKNISQSRIANGATRLQPITMLTGQAAGTLAALAVRGKVQPRSVDVTKVQHELLKTGAVLALEEDSDLERGSQLWQAAQFVTAKSWMKATDGRFVPEGKLTRAQAAELLGAAFGVAEPFGEFRPAVVAKATFTDVPLFDRYSEPVERLWERKALGACASGVSKFCPKEVETIGDFVKAVSVLRKEQGAAKVKTDLHLVDSDPLTRGQAAQILYALATEVLPGSLNFGPKSE